MIRLDRCAVAPGVRRRIEVSTAIYNTMQGREQETGYSVTGNKLNAGSLRTPRWSVEDAWQCAVQCFREHNPKARLIVTYCRECGTGTRPDTPCVHSVS